MENWEMDGKPALLVLHMQEGTVGKGTFISAFRQEAFGAVKDSGMVEKIQSLLAAFREKNLPVIFVNVIPNPIGVLPSYGKLFKINEESESGENLLHSKSLQEALEVIPEMERRADEPVLFNWLLGSFTNSGLDTVLKLKSVKTLVLAGFAAHQVVFCTALQAGDLWYSVIIPRDASASLPHERKAYAAVMEIMAPLVSLVTTTDDVIAHLKQ